MSGGFNILQDDSGHSFTGKIQTAFAAANAHGLAIAVGDMVSGLGTCENNTLGVVEVTRTLASDTKVLGVVVSVDPDFSNLERKGLEASEGSFIKVAVGKDVIFTAEHDGAPTTKFVATDVGDYAVIAPNTSPLSGSLRPSGMKLSAPVVSETTTTTMQIIGLHNPDSSNESSEALVRILHSNSDRTVF